MADLQQQVVKAAGEGFESGESLVAATKCEREGGVKRRALGAGLGGAVGMVAALKTGIDPSHSVGGEALPHSMVLGLTDRRIAVLGCSTMTGKPTSIIRSIPLAEIADVDTGSGRVLGRKLAKFSLTFVDGAVLSLEAASSESWRAEAFCEALAATLLARRDQVPE
jgi:hypothetical protein